MTSGAGDRRTQSEDKYNKKRAGAVGVVLELGSEEGVCGNLPGRDGVVGVFEQPEGGFRTVVTSFVYGAVKQDEVSPAASDVEVGYGYKGYDLGSDNSRERGLVHSVYSPLKVCSPSQGLSV